MSFFRRAVTRLRVQKYQTMGERFTVFVYGTLKRGQPNHGLIEQRANGGEATFTGTAITQKMWPLVISSAYNIPFLLHAEGKGKHVKGEVYEVDTKMLEALDELESHPRFYEREVTPVLLTTDTEGKALQSKEPTQVWCYFMKNFKPHLLELPMYDCYDNNGDHGLRYVASEELSDPEEL